MGEQPVCFDEEAAPRCTSPVFPPGASGLTDVVLCNRDGALWVSARWDIGSYELASCEVDASGELHVDVCASDQGAALGGPRRCTGEARALRTFGDGRRPMDVSLPPAGECAPAFFGTDIQDYWPTTLETERLDACGPPIVIVSLPGGGYIPDGCRVRVAAPGELVVEVASRNVEGGFGQLTTTTLACAAPSLAPGRYSVRNPQGDALGALQVE